MEMLQHFLQCYLSTSIEFKDLEKLIKEFKEQEPKEDQKKFIAELDEIIKENNYYKASHHMKKCGMLWLNEKKAEAFFKFIYNTLMNIPTDMTIDELYKIIRK